jgi:hypothetical protein
MTMSKTLAELRAENLRRAAAAGVAVGVRSELELGNRPGLPRRKKHRKAKAGKTARKKAKAPPMGSRAGDATAQWRRISGSYENGKRR